LFYILNALQKFSNRIINKIFLNYFYVIITKLLDCLYSQKNFCLAQDISQSRLILFIFFYLRIYIHVYIYIYIYIYIVYTFYLYIYVQKADIPKRRCNAGINLFIAQMESIRIRFAIFQLSFHTIFKRHIVKFVYNNRPTRHRRRCSCLT